MPKITDEQKKKIVSDYIECKSYRATGKKHNVAANTVKKYVLEDEEFAQKCADKKEEIEKDILAELDKRKDAVLEFYDNGIERMNELLKTSKDIKGIGTALGIMIDKQMINKNYELKTRELDLKEREIDLKESSAVLDGDTIELVSNVLAEVKKQSDEINKQAGVGSEVVSP
jgi:hypothetical protein